MKLDHMTWLEVEAYLAHRNGVFLSTGSIEQHGPMGLIGTDALCSSAIAERAADLAGAICAPGFSYTPAPFNTAFPGTVSISTELFLALVSEVITGLSAQGFTRIYIVNGHGANLAPLSQLAPPAGTSVRYRSWWDFEPVNVLRKQYYGDWEGMHATPSEIAITQALHRQIEPSEIAKQPPRKLSPDYMRAHTGDRHGPPDEHRRDFPDGRVGSHSALARPEHGHLLVEAAVTAIAEDFDAFCRS
ncbi:creatininase family protein [Hoeflea sp. AS60]|uniref:creatininase family protein n=1 Tax=Hoeflea sp. AS60 TaxID=3135780 RepID=UPI00316C5486